MNDFFFARSQMAMSLGFHIIFAAVGIGMPLLMAIAEGLHLRRREPILLDRARSARWRPCGIAAFDGLGRLSRPKEFSKNAEHRSARSRPPNK